MTLCLIIDADRVLLGYKKRGFGQGWWNGFGGKVEAGEGLEAAARREVNEEAGIALEEVTKVGVLEFTFADKPAEIFVGHIFKGEGIVGEPHESEEMKPQWFAIEDIPYEQMWPADRYWLPVFLKGKTFTGRLHFSANNEILKKEITVF